MLNIQHLIADAKCFAVIHEMRWPGGVRCPKCGSGAVYKRVFHTHQAYRQRYGCQDCGQQFDDLSGAIFEGHHQPLRMWVLCLYFMGLNLSNEQIGAELDLSPGDAQAMTSQLRQGVVDNKSQSNWAVKSKPMKCTSWLETSRLCWDDCKGMVKWHY